jgi:hypothetical protein
MMGGQGVKLPQWHELFISVVIFIGIAMLAYDGLTWLLEWAGVAK